MSPQDSVTRREMLRKLLDLPVTYVGLVAWVGAGSTLTSCGQSQVSGQEAGEPQETARKSGSRRDGGTRKGATSPSSKSQGSGSQDDRGEPLRVGSAGETDDQRADLGGQDSSAKTDPRPKLSTNVRGAQPNGGFFARGAPTLTKEQIEAGQPIEGTCEGTNHKLVITSQHLAELAEGRSVRVQSATNSHFLNPTVHNHMVTYSPIT